MRTIDELIDSAEPVYRAMTSEQEENLRLLNAISRQAIRLRSAEKRANRACCLCAAFVMIAAIFLWKWFMAVVR